LKTGNQSFGYLTIDLHFVREGRFNVWFRNGERFVRKELAAESDF
jgi:hypothetical protein